MGFINNVKHLYNKHGSAALTAAAIGFSVASSITSYFAGKKAGQNPEMTLKEKALNVAVPVVTEGLAVTSAIASNSKSSGQIAALMATQVLNDKKRKENIKKATEIIGEENMNKIKESMNPVHDIPKQLPDGRMLTVDGYTGARGFGTIEDAWNGINQFQALYYKEGFAAYGKLLEFCNLERFDGEHTRLPFTVVLSPIEEEENVCLASELSDMDIGYSSYYLNDCGYESSWIDITPSIHTDVNGNQYILIECDHDPIVYFEQF